MKKVFKGCLIFFLTIIGLVVIGIIALYFYSLTPNEVEFSNSPLKTEQYLSEISFDQQEIPDFILNQPEENILYQMYMIDDGMAKTVIYKVVIKMDKEITLNSSLPLSQAETGNLNKNISFQNIGNGFEPKIIIPMDNKVESGRKLIIYSPIDNISMPLKNGSYSTYHKDIDKDGYASDVIIFDKESKLLYFERERYYAFQ
jgi:hypothetical protein